jgi:catechol 2,3-dioxygenase-like lactoylglutathione lyase family enzyme
MLHIGSIVMNVYDVRRAAAFWCEALDYRPRDEIADDWAVLVPASGTGPNLSMNLSDSAPQERPHVHLDLYAEDQSGEVERLLGLGARRVEWEYPDGADFVVLADTEGNKFDVIDKSG